MQYTEYIIICIIIFIIVIILTKNINVNIREYFDDITIPKIIHQTYMDKSRIPQKVYDNINQYANGYTHIIYDDNECIEFIKKYYSQIVLDKFLSLKKGAHKADLFRYCVLYIHGGIYMDIKTILIQDISTIFNKDSDIKIYTSIGNNNTTIYQGIIATVPRNVFFLKLIDLLVNTPTNTIDSYYLVFTKQFYDLIKSDIRKEPVIGKNTGINSVYYLFKENCTKDATQCMNKLDRYKLCCGIYDKDNMIMKTRYSDFPW
jgi:hypothetical protein